MASFDTRRERELLVDLECTLEATAANPTAINLIDLIVVGGVRQHVPVVILRVRRGSPVVADQTSRRDPTERFADCSGVERAESVLANLGAERALGDLL